MAGLGAGFAALVRSAENVLRAIRPPRGWEVPVLVTAGVFCGIGLVILRLSNATAYLSDKPEACINCHVMVPQYATWHRGSHANVATCNDCHVPHDNVARKYFFKGMDGGRHSFMFTFRMEPQVIRVHEAGQTVIQENCIHCHDKLLQDSRLSKVTAPMAWHGEGKLCWDCHRETPHGRVNSLASVPDARFPGLSPAVPEWIQRFLDKPQEN